jgi:hypothetical protein
LIGEHRQAVGQVVQEHGEGPQRPGYPFQQRVGRGTSAKWRQRLQIMLASGLERVTVAAQNDHQIRVSGLP